MKWLRGRGPGLLGLAGMAVIAWGIGMIYVPAGFIAGGVCLIALAGGIVHAKERADAGV